MKQTNKHIISPVAALLIPSTSDKGFDGAGTAAAIQRECRTEANTEWVTQVALTVCVDGHHQ